MDEKCIELYEITGAYADAAAALMECETEKEYSDALEAFNAIEYDLAEAGLIKAKVLRNLQLIAASRKAYEETFKAEAKRLESRRKATENAIKRLKNDVLFAMDTAGLERIRTDIGTWFIYPSMKCDVTDPYLVPQEFVKSYTPEIDKDAATKHFRSTGEIIDGLEITENRTAVFR